MHPKEREREKKYGNENIGSYVIEINIMVSVGP